jgi:hypothetical protein
MPAILPGVLAIDDEGQDWSFGVKNEAVSSHAIQGNVLAQSRNVDRGPPV